jgi:A/G-specific adenine glycosylase
VDPYKVWLSEMMLQQTTVATVKSYFEKFLERWPTLKDLAQAPEEDILHGWQGLGYYSRARNLYRCAQIIKEHHGGKFPSTITDLLQLPGIGPYSAAAIASIAFNQPETVVDGNVMRVISRLFAVTDPLPKSAPALTKLAKTLTPLHRPGDYAQAIMDLGATLCTPKSPACFRCPWNSSCEGYKQGDPESYPRRLPKPEKPTRFGIAWWLVDGEGKFALVKRPPKGLLAHMMGVPTTPWEDTPFSVEKGAPLAPLPGQWHLLPGEIKHTFTHFHLRLQVMTLSLQEKGQASSFKWCAPEEMDQHALPTLMKKIIFHGREQALRRKENPELFH